MKLEFHEYKIRRVYIGVSLGPVFARLCFLEKKPCPRIESGTKSDIDFISMKFLQKLNVNVVMLYFTSYDCDRHASDM